MARTVDADLCQPGRPPLLPLFLVGIELDPCFRRREPGDESARLVVAGGLGPDESWAEDRHGEHEEGEGQEGVKGPRVVYGRPE